MLRDLQTAKKARGVDALNTVLEVLLFAAAMKLGQGWNTVLTLFGCMSCSRTILQSAADCTTATLTFYIQTWDEYYTKTLTLGVVSGPVEGVLTLCIVYAVTAVKGGGTFWQQSLLESVGVPRYPFIPAVVYEMPWNEAYMVYGGLVLIFNTIQRYDKHSPNLHTLPRLLAKPQ